MGTANVTKKASSTAIRRCPMVPLNWTEELEYRKPILIIYSTCNSQKKTTSFFLYFVNYTLNTQRPENVLQRSTL
jgi:hypothetical protein